MPTDRAIIEPLSIAREQLLADQETLYPLEFFIEQTPRATGAKSIGQWKDTVERSARHRAMATDKVGLLWSCPVAVTIFYFLPEPMQGDVDNIVKPILDAMIGVAYLDDREVERVLVQKFEPQFERVFTDPSEELAAALDAEPPVVYIRVDDDLSWRLL